jgi:hypothetical protein
VFAECGTSTDVYAGANETAALMYTLSETEEVRSCSPLRGSQQLKNFFELKGRITPKCYAAVVLCYADLQLGYVFVDSAKQSASKTGRRSG